MRNPITSLTYTISAHKSRRENGSACGRLRFDVHVKAYGYLGHSVKMVAGEDNIGGCAP